MEQQCSLALSKSWLLLACQQTSLPIGTCIASTCDLPTSRTGMQERVLGLSGKDGEAAGGLRALVCRQPDFIRSATHAFLICFKV